MLGLGLVTAKRRPDKSVSYVRHSAFAGRFWRIFDDWYLTIEPAYVFTRDGVRPDGYAGPRLLQDASTISQNAFVFGGGALGYCGSLRHAAKASSTGIIVLPTSNPSSQRVTA
jgi:hypothetical protein